MPPQDQTSHRPIKILLHAVFLLSGITTILIGQVLPILSTRFSLNDLEAGYFFPAQFSGSLLGTFFTNWFGRRHKFLTATFLGCLLMAAGVMLMNSGSLYVCLLGFSVNGVGIGLTLPSINMLILEMNPMRSASALSILNFCWGVGAILCKPFVDFFARGTDILIVSLVLAIPLFAAAATILFFSKDVEGPRMTTESRVASENTPIWSTRLAWVLAIFNFIHVGFESGMGGWLTTYTDRLEHDSAIHLISPTLLYFFFFVVGRGVAPLLFRFLNENAVLLINLLMILAGMMITLLAKDIAVLGVGAAISGFGTSSVFPTTVARFGRIFGPGATRRATPLFICGTLGAASVTWLIGFLSDSFGDLRSGMFVLAGSIVLLIILQIGISLRSVKLRERIV